MTNVYRLGAGTLSVATLQGSSSYIVENFTAGAGESWYVGQTGNIVPYTVIRPSLGGRHGGMGYVQLPDWVMVLSKSQVDYLFTTFMSNRIDGLVTLQTFNMNQNAWECYTAVMRLDYPAHVSVNNNWLPNTTLKFTRAVLIT